MGHNIIWFFCVPDGQDLFSLYPIVPMVAEFRFLWLPEVVLFRQRYTSRTLGIPWSHLITDIIEWVTQVRYKQMDK